MGSQGEIAAEGVPAQASLTALSPWAPVAIRNEAMTRMPVVSVTATMTMGAFMLARWRGAPLPELRDQ
jgi:hypothetical protein